MSTPAHARREASGRPHEAERVPVAEGPGGAQLGLDAHRHTRAEGLRGGGERRGGEGERGSSEEGSHGKELEARINKETR